MFSMNGRIANISGFAATYGLCHIVVCVCVCVYVLESLKNTQTILSLRDFQTQDTPRIWLVSQICLPRSISPTL